MGVKIFEEYRARLEKRSGTGGGPERRANPQPENDGDGDREASDDREHGWYGRVPRRNLPGPVVVMARDLKP